MGKPLEDKLNIVCERMKESGRPLILYCGGQYGEIAYNSILRYDMEPVCMCDNSPEKFEKDFFNLPILNYNQCKEKYKDAIFLITSESRSTCNIIAQSLEREGKKRDEDYFVFMDFDYKESSFNYLEQIIKRHQVILVGDFFLCKALSEFLDRRNISCKSDILYCSQFKNENDTKIDGGGDGQTIAALSECKEAYPEAIYFVLCKETEDLIDKYNNKIKEAMYQIGIKNISFYFNHNYTFLTDCLEQPQVEKGRSLTETGRRNKIRIEDVDKVLFLFDSDFSGSYFMNTILDSHPYILSLGYNPLQANLWFYIQEIKNKATLEEFPHKLLQCYKGHLDREDRYNFDSTFPDPEKFITEFHSAAEGYEKLNDKQLFISVYIAYHYMIYQEEPIDKDNEGRDIKPVLYLEPHGNFKAYPVLGKWLHDNFKNVVYLKLLRNTITRLGSIFRLQTSYKGWIELNDVKRIGNLSLETKNFKEYKQNVVALRFEDIKLYPHETLNYLLDLLEIPWSDALEETTLNGKPASYSSKGSYQTAGYDLRPVYNTYDEYFSSFDRFRLDLLFHKKQRAYGYPYLDLDLYQFQDSQIESFFKYPYKFEKYMNFTSREQEKRFWNEVYEINMTTLHDLLQKEEYLDFYDYIHIKDN